MSRKRLRTTVKGSQHGLMCPACGDLFPNIKKKDDLIRIHMSRETECKKSIISCPNQACNQKFLNYKGLDMHLRKNKSCLDAEKEMNKVNSFAHSAVAFPSTSNVHAHSSSSFSTASNQKKCASNNQSKSTKDCRKEPEEVVIKTYSSTNFSFGENQCLLYGVTDYCVTKRPLVKAIKKIPQEEVSKFNNKNRQDRSKNKKNISSTSVVQFPAKTHSLSPKETKALLSSDYDSNCDSDYTDHPYSSSSSSNTMMQRGSDDDESYLFNGDNDESYILNSDDVSMDTERQVPLEMSSGNHNQQESLTSSTNSLPSRGFISMKETEESEKELFIEDKDFKDGIELLNLLITKKISLHRYADFMRWKHGTGYHFPSFEQIIKSATDRIYGSTLAKKMSPKISIVRLPSGRSAPLVLFESDAMIYDLISDTDVTTRKNMIFDPTAGNPFVVANSNVYADFETSTYFTEILKSNNFDPERDVYFPIVLYIDELKLDAFGKLGLEPVVMSFMIYNRATRNLSQAWRVIGYMPNFGTMFAKQSYSADEKAEDYHFCLGKILDGIRNLQQNRSGHEWTFKFVDGEGNVSTHRRNLHFPLAYVIGDAKGNDLLCGRFGSHHNTKCVGRDCDAKTATCDDPSVRCNFLRMSRLKTMDKAELSNISFRKLSSNAFDGIWFGPHPYGINGCVPAEPLHQINLGILERLPAALFSRLTTALKCILDRHAGFICTHFYRQSDRSYPDISSFTSGISEMKRLTGREKLSRVYVIYLVLLTQDFKDIIIGSMGRVHKEQNEEEENSDEDKETLSVIDRKEYNNWVNVFEETLLFTSWIYLEEHPKVFFKGGRNSVAAKRIADFVDMYREAAPRRIGMGLKIVKFHQLLHLWWIIKMFGSLLNVDGARGESNAIVLTKQPGLCTQMRHALLNVQTASETFKRNVILKCYNCMHNTKMKLYERSETSTPRGDNDKCGPCGSKFNLIFDYANNRIVTKWTSPKMKSKLCVFPPKLSGAIYDKLSYYNAGCVGKRIQKVQGFTEFKTKCPQDKSLHTFRACPSFRSSRPWFDWAMIKWSTSHNHSLDIEAQILTMLDMTTIVFEDCPPQMPNNNGIVRNTPHSLIECLHVAFIHSAKEQTKRDMSHTRRKSSVAFWSKMESNYQMIDINSIHRPCFVVVDKMDATNGGKYVPGHATEIISFLPKNIWSLKFLDYTDTELTEEAGTRRDDDVVEEDLKPYEI